MVCLFACRYLVNLGCIKPLCDLLTVMDSKIVQVALNGLENILRLGEQEAKQENNGTGVNPYCSLIEEAYGTVHNVRKSICVLYDMLYIIERYWENYSFCSVS